MPTLIAYPANLLSALSSNEFRIRLTATPWQDLTIEQLDAIDENERLFTIANDVINVLTAEYDSQETIQGKSSDYNNEWLPYLS
jgi:hypothetical protein